MNCVPRHYRSIQGWFSFGELYQSAVERFPSGSHFVEVGVWKGKSTCFMAEAIRASGKAIRFDVVDTWLGSAEHAPAVEAAGGGDQLFLEFLRNMQAADVLDLMTPIRLLSCVAAQLYEDRSLDLVFIDASHEYNDVRADILAWMPKVKPGGILAGHDYGHDFPEVMRAVDEVIGGDVAMPGRCWCHEVLPDSSEDGRRPN